MWTERMQENRILTFITYNLHFGVQQICLFVLVKYRNLNWYVIAYGYREYATIRDVGTRVGRFLGKASF